VAAPVQMQNSVRFTCLRLQHPDELSGESAYAARIGNKQAGQTALPASRAEAAMVDEDALPGRLDAKR